MAITDPRQTSSLSRGANQLPPFIDTHPGLWVDFGELADTESVYFTKTNGVFEVAYAGPTLSGQFSFYADVEDATAAQTAAVASIYQSTAANESVGDEAGAVANAPASAGNTITVVINTTGENELGILNDSTETLAIKIRRVSPVNDIVAAS